MKEGFSSEDWARTKVWENSNWTWWMECWKFSPRGKIILESDFGENNASIFLRWSIRSRFSPTKPGRVVQEQISMSVQFFLVFVTSTHWIPISPCYNWCSDAFEPQQHCSAVKRSSQNFGSRLEDHTWVCFYSYLEMLKTSKMPVLLGLGMIMSKWLEPYWIYVCLSSWLSFTVNQIYTTVHRLELTAQWKFTTLCIRRAENL